MASETPFKLHSERFSKTQGVDGFRFDLMGHLTLKCLQQLGGKTGFGNFGWKKTGGFRFCWRVLGVGEVVAGVNFLDKNAQN